eukprot:2093182-Pleurochrysis_carterae.AAC.1
MDGSNRYAQITPCSSRTWHNQLQFKRSARLITAVSMLEWVGYSLSLSGPARASVVACAWGQVDGFILAAQFEPCQINR